MKSTQRPSKPHNQQPKPNDTNLQTDFTPLLMNRQNLSQLLKLLISQ
ncbi:hypothetical protein [Komarekiella delphini-convector]|nr:hypothetical protein [Komarekiella delphini-convector]